MKTIFRQTQLYKFLFYCHENNLPKNVLDCGAGGNCPPLALFSHHGYQVQGIEQDKDQIQKANDFAAKYGLNLNISAGDMRELPFPDQTISYAYSYNSIFHLSKTDIGKAVNEMKRVLKPGGLCFINFLSTHDFGYGEGEKVGDGEYSQKEGEKTVWHSFFNEDEADLYFEDMKILFKENRVLERLYQEKMIRQGFVDYIAEKR